ncbi:MAG: carboxypeptidase-like regulatory domain-containing protein [Bacteroidota bacterium]
MKIFRILLLILLPVIVRAQSVAITGKVFDADTKTPVAGASVFLSSSSFGTSTGADGRFALNGLRAGQYLLVVTAVGYESNTQTILLNTEPVKLDIALSIKVTQLKEVKITSISKSDKKAALKRFKEEFIGTDKNADDCKITNPEVLNFAFYENKRVLEASTNEFLVIENNALGYRIKYMLKNFTSNLNTGDVTYAGSQVFEEMPGSDSKKKKWYKKRDEAYYGSARHFYRALGKDSLADAGFKIYRLTRQFNTKRPPENVIDENIQKYRHYSMDSTFYWMGVKNSSHYTRQKLIGKGQVAVSSIVQPTDKPGLSALVFQDHLYVVYTKKWETTYFRDVYRVPHDLNYATTIVSYTGDNHLLLFDKNGSIIGDSPLYEGTWSAARISTLLPVDYTPYGKQP